MKTVMRTQSLSTGYRSGRTVNEVVGNLDLKLRAGELVCLLGPNGAGKSTLIRTIANMQEALAGHVEINGHRLTDMSAKDISTLMSVVLTDRISVGSMTVFSLVALGRHPYTNWFGQLSEEDEQKVRQAIDDAGASDLVHRPVNELSDGERQKVMIARALAQEPQLMVLDEPTAFLDLPRRVELMRLLRRLAHEQGKAILCSTHDLDLALNSADCLWLLSSDGTISVGGPEDLVLSGAFETTFETADVEFNRATGAFIVHEPHGNGIGLIGEGLEADWTHRALERIGFEVVDSEKMDLVLELRTTKERTIWVLHRTGENIEFGSIYEVTQHLLKALRAQS